jgi:hypothetical protein
MRARTSNVAVIDYVSSPLAARELGNNRCEIIAGALTTLESTTRATDERQIIEKFLVRNDHRSSSS